MSSEIKRVSTPTKLIQIFDYWFLVQIVENIFDKKKKEVKNEPLDESCI